MDVRSIDPTECMVRHVVRGVSSDASAKPVARVYFARAEVLSGADGLNGRQGWQQAECTLALSDDGAFTLMLPNVAGDDGVLHRRRFRILTDPNYEPGEEWLEFWTDADPEQPLFVGTPDDYDKSKSTVTLKGTDLCEVLNGSLSSDVDVWDGAAPADVFRHYSRLPTLAYSSETLVMVDGVGGSVDSHAIAFAAIPGDCWIVHARLRWLASYSGHLTPYVKVNVGSGVGVQVSIRPHVIARAVGSFGIVQGPNDKIDVPGSIDVRIVARYDRIFLFAEGELACEFRRPGPFSTESSVTVSARSGQAALDAIHVESLEPFAARGASAVIERRLPGIPPATGLRGRYYSAAQAFAQHSPPVDAALELLFALAGESGDPVVDRVDAQVNFPLGTAEYPPGLPGAYAARWTGAIYLDLAATDRKIRLTGLQDCARLYVGKTLRGQEAATSWSTALLGTATITSPALRAHIGEVEAGWYPILIEQFVSINFAGMVLQDVAVDSGGSPTGAWQVVPQSRLSPIGCYDDLVRLTPHRSVIGDVAQAFGYQWRVEHRSLESGEFPGQLTFRSLIGRQTDVIVDDDDVGTDVQVAGAARDVVDGILADAAGISDPAGSGQLSAHVIDYARAGGHMALRQAYESLSEITERPLLQTRIDSLLALRSSPNEQVGVRPTAQRDVVDTFPLTGARAKMEWQPGDGVRLQLDSIDVFDQSPRQMTAVTWPVRRDGLGVPTVAWRQRPRSPSAMLKRLRSAIFGPRRTYQGGIAIITGTTGNASATGTLGDAGSDGYSRVALPARMADLVRAYLNVMSLTGTGWSLEVTGAAGGPVSGIGRYDVTDRILADALGAPYAYARLQTAGSTGAYLVALELHVRV